MNEVADNIDNDNAAGGRMLLIVGLGLGLLLGAGGFYMYSNVMPEPEATKKEEAVKKVEVKVPTDLKSEKLERLTAPLHVKSRTGRNAYVGTYFMDVIISTENDDQKIIVSRLKYNLRHAFNLAITKEDIMVEGSDRNIDVEKLSTVFMRYAEEIVGPDVIYSITIQNLQLIRY